MVEEIPTYDDLELRIERVAEGSYRVLASASDGRKGRGTFEQPITDDELDDFVQRVGLVRRRRRPELERMEDIKSLGSKLFNALIKDEVRDIYQAARTEAKGRGLRITLQLSDAPELMRLPWEFLYSRPKFLSQSTETPVVRTLDLGNKRRPLEVGFPLKILGMVSASTPEGCGELNTNEECRRLENALSELNSHGLVELEWLERATLAELGRRVSEPDDIHVLHYIGHGAYDETNEAGILVLETSQGRAHEVSGEQLGRMLQDEKSLRLVVLNSCEGARTSHIDPFGGVATALVEFDIPAVIAMQFEISDQAAIAFSERFYTGLAQGLPVDAAVAPARRAILGVSREAEFGTPVLFLRADDARLFDLSHAAAQPGYRDAPALFRTPQENLRSAREAEANVSVEFELQHWLNPALLKNHLPAIVRLVLTADRPMAGVVVSITCDAGFERSTVSLTQDLGPGPQPLEVAELRFPVLDLLIDQAAGRRWLNFTVRCTYGSAVLAETTRSVLWMGPSEWLDRKDMWHFIPAFVDPNAGGVLQVLDKANIMLKTFDPTSSFDGYLRGRPELVLRQVEAFFNCLRDEPFKLSYINVPPLEVFIPGESMPSGQSVRTPTEVIEHHRGTCHDLAILFASCLEHVGINPLIVLKPGHTYVGFWTAWDTWNDFWKAAQANPLRLQQVSGRSWIITSIDEMSELVDRGEVVLLEASRVTDRNATFQDALTQGRSNLASGLGFDVAVDVVASRQFVQPL